jgi:hypothetical protein
LHPKGLPLANFPSCPLFILHLACGELSGKAMHLAEGFQFAWFSSVIAMM